jgi:hypothetical protein
MTKKPKRPSEPTVLRYSRDFGGWHVTSMSSRSFSARGGTGTEPEWLKAVLAVAHVGGHCMNIPRPPPDLIVWFRVNDDFELVDFVHYDT